ncbi:MAG: hypothetical protein QOH06_1989 [Acidobacteriota bacterium]|jgi:hypothetical protein|nr:hypothetical protein [Acidobacteriota bacterium]
MQKTLCFVALSLLATFPAAAKTPDGQTPSEETICDGQIGAAYGLCNAYCEAMDCESPAPHASPTACAKVLKNYMKHTGMMPPCAVTCPCPEELPLFAAFVAGTQPIEECFATDDTISVTAEDQEFSIVVSAEGGFCSDNGEPPLVPLTPAEALVCRLLLRDTAEAQGVACVPPE